MRARVARTRPSPRTSTRTRTRPSPRARPSERAAMERARAPSSRPWTKEKRAGRPEVLKGVVEWKPRRRAPTRREVGGRVLARESSQQLRDREGRQTSRVSAEPHDVHREQRRRPDKYKVQEANDIVRIMLAGNFDFGPEPKFRRRCWTRRRVKFQRHGLGVPFAKEVVGGLDEPDGRARTRGNVTSGPREGGRRRRHALRDCGTDLWVKMPLGAFLEGHGPNPSADAAAATRRQLQICAQRHPGLRDGRGHLRRRQPRALEAGGDGEARHKDIVEDVESTAHPASSSARVGYDAEGDAGRDDVLGCGISPRSSRRASTSRRRATCVHAFIYDMKHKTTGKEAKGCVDYFEWGFDKAEVESAGSAWWGNPAPSPLDAGGGRPDAGAGASRRTAHKAVRRRGAADEAAGGRDENYAKWGEILGVWGTGGFNVPRPEGRRGSRSTSPTTASAT